MYWVNGEHSPRGTESRRRSATPRPRPDRDETSAHKQREVELPAWILDSDRKLHRFEKYACKVYGLPRLLRSFTDGRRDPDIPTLDVVNSLFHAALLRRPSINAPESIYSPLML